MTEQTPRDAAPAEAVDPQIAKDRELIVEAKKKGLFATLGAYTKLSGPGWLQSAITLGGGSLSSSLYLGVLAGFALLWLQPLAMIIGVIMLSAIAYVTLSTGEKPFQAINKHVNPVLGWGWLIATLMANCVWSLPQFALATKAFRQNLMPGVFGSMPADTANAWIAGSIAVLCIIMVYFYDAGGKMVKVFDVILKLMVGIIVISFFGVVVFMSAKGALDWGAIGSGFIPDFTLLWRPADTFTPVLNQVADVEFRTFWSKLIVDDQQDVLIAAAATAVGINMTFLLPYSMLKKGWNKTFRGLAAFDLSTGLFIPFILATGCVVIASANRFHTQPAVHFADPAALGEVNAALAGPGFAQMDNEIKIKKLAVKLETVYDKEEAKQVVQDKPLPGYVAGLIVKATSDKGYAAKSPRAKENLLRDLLLGADGSAVKGYRGIALKRVKKQMGKKYDEAIDLARKGAKDEKVAVKAKEDELINKLPLADRRIAAMLVHRDNVHLANALQPLTGRLWAQVVFGVGVVGMAISSIIILMLINGFCVCEAVNRPSKGWLYRFGCLIPAVGILGPFFWKDAAPWLAMPTSVFGFIVIPIAYATFGLVLNQRKLLGDNMPKGIGRWIWNLFIFVGVVAVTIGSVYMAYKKTTSLPGFWGGGWVGPAGIGVFIGLAVLVHFVRKAKSKEVLL